MAQSPDTAEYTDCISADGKDSPNECSTYNSRQSDGEAPVMLELWGMRRNPLWSSLQGSLWPSVVARDNVLSMG